MRLCTYERAGQLAVGVQVDGRVYPTDYGDMLDLINAGEAGLRRARAFADAARPVEVARLLAPLPRPRTIFGCGVNYRSHGDENPGVVFPDEPRIDFIKLPSAVVGPDAPIVIPSAEGVICRPDGFHVDYEVELGVVMGRSARHVGRADALEYVFGYTLFNDVGARAVQFGPRGWLQADLAKNFDSFAPMGPVIITRDELPDLSGAHISCMVNGELRQDALLNEQLFPVPVLIEWISSIITMQPGDCIMTGTPAGCGTFRTPPIWLQAGDQVVVAEDTIGRLSNRVVSAP